MPGAIVYVTDIAAPDNPGTGVPHSAAVADGIVLNLDSRMSAVEALLDAGYTLASPPLTATSSSVTFHFEDSNSDTFDVVVALPIASPNPRGAWQNGTFYARLDEVTVSTLGTFRANVDHISASSPATFDPSATDDDSDATPLWTQVGGVFSTHAVTQTQTGTSFTPTITDKNTYNRMTNAAGCIVTIPSGVFAENDEIHFRAETDGPVIIEGESDVTINRPHPLEDTELPWRGATVTLKQVDDDGTEWDYIGLGTDASSDVSV